MSKNEGDNLDTDTPEDNSKNIELGNALSLYNNAHEDTREENSSTDVITEADCAANSSTSTFIIPRTSSLKNVLYCEPNAPNSAINMSEYDKNDYNINYYINPEKVEEITEGDNASISQNHDNNENSINKDSYDSSYDQKKESLDSDNGSNNIEPSSNHKEKRRKKGNNKESEYDTLDLLNIITNIANDSVEPSSAILLANDAENFSNDNISNNTNEEMYDINLNEKQVYSERANSKSNGEKENLLLLPYHSPKKKRRVDQKSTGLMSKETRLSFNVNEEGTIPGGFRNDNCQNFMNSGKRSQFQFLNHADRLKICPCCHRPFIASPIYFCLLGALFQKMKAAYYAEKKGLPPIEPKFCSSNNNSASELNNTNSYDICTAQNEFTRNETEAIEDDGNDVIASINMRQQQQTQEHVKFSYKSTYFRTLETVGVGSFGQVYRVQHILHGISLGIYALKEVSLGDTDMKSSHPWLLRALGEVETLEKLHHPNIIGYHHCWSENGYLYILLDYAKAGSLGNLMPHILGRSMTSYEFLSILRDCLAALAHLHSCNLLHRDIKLQNFLLTSQYEDLEPTAGIDVIYQNNAALENLSAQERKKKKN